MLPKTLDSAIKLIVENITPEELVKTRELTKILELDEMAGRVHHTLGMMLRNELELWHPTSMELRQSIWDSLTPEKQEYYRSWWSKHGLDHTGKNMHADDASHTLLVAVLEKIKNSNV